uniref:GED domain-containing protein n=2 Tax=Strombidium inclinatum TaxID=197538 RepID=A0A7S3ISD7_9SPIT|mmetsp:Transcript_3510/g.5275  ORF Transcript_3510/g.5275 Transcript_3510/m.5275 type:complete len:352 (+) Transcript_3510:1032-2087(+)
MGTFVKDTAVELKGGSRINYIFYQVYCKEISEIKPFDALSDEDVKTAIRNASALHPNILIPEMAFEILSKKQIQRLESPSLQCVQLVFEELRKIVMEIEMPELYRFQGLRRKINEEMLQLLSSCLRPTNQMVKHLVMIQDAYINTYHPDFQKQAALNVKDMLERDEAEERKAGQRVMNKVSEIEESEFDQSHKVTVGQNLQMDERVKDFSSYEVNKYMQKNVRPIHMPQMQTFKRAEDDDPGQYASRSQNEIGVVKNLIVNYFNTVRKTMNDTVPKTIMAFLVNKSKNDAQNCLIQTIYGDGTQLQSLLGEDTETRQRREHCEEMAKTLRDSLDYLNEVRDFYFKEASEGL